MKSQFRGFLFEAKHLTGLLVAAATVGVLLYMDVAAVGQSTGSALPPTPKAPGDNPTTPAKVALGRLLFWDPLLSGPQDVACATCHHPQNGYAEDRDLSLGVTAIGLGSKRRQAPGSSIPIVKRNSPTVVNIAFSGSDESGRYDPATAPMFSDYKLHVMGVPDNPALPASDDGAEKTYAFRTASLRNLAFPAPYEHNGMFRTLSDVVGFYEDARGGRSRNPNVSSEKLDPLIRELGDFDEEDVDLVEFLRALSDDSFDRTIPERVPSGLPVGGRIQ